MISPPFREGIKAAVPIWVAYISTSFALGISAKAYGLSPGEILLMSALVFASPAQFAALEPLASGKPALQILLITFLINLRFLVMSAAIAPYFGRVRRAASCPGAGRRSSRCFMDRQAAAWHVDRRSPCPDFVLA